MVQPNAWVGISTMRLMMAGNAVETHVEDVRDAVNAAD